MASSIPASEPRRRGLDGRRRSGMTAVAAAVVVLLILIALFAPLLAPYAPDAQNLSHEARLQGPSEQHWLGTDDLGRDVLSRLIYGARISLFVVLVVEVIELIFGAGLGLLAGYYGGWLDTLVMRLADTMFAFPDILLAILITSILGKSIGFVFLALALVGWPSMVRL